MSKLKIYGTFAKLCKASNLLALHPVRKSEKKTHVGIKQHLKLPPRWATCQQRRAVWWPDVAGFIGPSLGLSLAVICRYNAFIKGFFQGWTGEVQGWEGHMFCLAACSPGCQWQIEEIWTCRFGKREFLAYDDIIYNTVLTALEKNKRDIFCLTRRVGADLEPPRLPQASKKPQEGAEEEGTFLFCLWFYRSRYYQDG